MARKYDRYGRNRQFRRNPTRSRKFFPHQLPFLPDFRLHNDLSEIKNGQKRKREYDVNEEDGYYQFMQQTQSQQKQINNEFAVKAAEALLTAEMGPGAIPVVLGYEMYRNPKKFSYLAGTSVFGGVGLAAYMSAKNLI